MSIVYLEFLSDRTVQRAWGSVNACLTEATLHMPSFWPQPPSPSWLAGCNYLLPLSRQCLFETWKGICPMYLDTWTWPFHLQFVSPGPLEVWLSNKEETSGTMFSHIFGHNQSYPSLLSRWNWKQYNIWYDYLRNSRVTIMVEYISSETPETTKFYLLGSCYSFLANNKTGLVRQWERRICLQSRHHRCHKIPPGWTLS